MSRAALRASCNMVVVEQPCDKTFLSFCCEVGGTRPCFVQHGKHVCFPCVCGIVVRLSLLSFEPVGVRVIYSSWHMTAAELYRSSVELGPIWSSYVTAFCCDALGVVHRL